MKLGARLLMLSTQCARLESTSSLISVSKVAAHCFYRLRQLRRIRRSLDAESTATLVRDFVTSRIDYAVILFSPVLRRLLLTSCNEYTQCCRVRHQRHRQIYDRQFSQLFHEKLHWLDVRDRVTFKLQAWWSWSIDA